jgi:hypothetical protein
MTDRPGREQPRRPAFVRLLRWQPRSYLQVWLLAASEVPVVLAAYYFLAPALLGRATGMGSSPMGFIGATWFAVVYGLAQSYLLKRRRRMIR